MHACMRCCDILYVRKIEVDLTFEEELGSYKKQLTAESRQSVIYFLPEYRPAIYRYIREAEVSE